MTARRRLVVEADGGSRGNPGVAGYGALVRDAETGALLAERAAPLGKQSNNVAEYSGLIAGLEAAYAIEPGADVDVAMDSKLVVEQMSGRWKIKHEDMRRLALRARDLVGRFEAAGGSVRFRWVPRERNKAADALSNEGMDGETIDRTFGGEPAVEEPPPGGAPTLVAEALAYDPENPTRVVLVRHGVTDFTDEGRLDGRGGADPSLNETGRRQARAAADAVRQLVGDTPVRLVTSTLARAVETGAVVAAALDVAAEADPAWDEQSFGDWDGVLMGDLRTEDPAGFRALRADPAYARPGGESHEELVARVVPAWERVLADGGTTVVVCHRKVIMVVLAHVLGLDHVSAWRLAAAPGSLTALEVLPWGELSVAFTNRT
ncbi:Phosphoglycerate mutase [Nostocoides japonicum T1-X7]|uniref:Phosphoglycerate mutase n=1 Tax=Nostocoides japonicum T1-X7 TaxID=1194083 RepID=A0A077M2G5_9MICO|nr:histidine phosphatase family protein [Tetrasphaera japonica]CCH78434.1 Phosphoglycerate mutase [Tetrasphaera japonica T1-X7]